jgi:hypothetical protein
MKEQPPQFGRPLPVQSPTTFLRMGVTGRRRGFLLCRPALRGVVSCARPHRVTRV